MDNQLLDRFSANFTVDDAGCWVWLRAVTAHGYGTLSVSGATTYAHRLSYEHYREPLRGRYVDHLCRNRRCVNPDHLEAVSNVANVMRGEGITATNKRKTHCKHGHLFDAENTAIQKQGWRRCRACQRERYAAKRHR